MTNYTAIPDIRPCDETDSLLLKGKASKKDYPYLKVGFACFMMVVVTVMGGAKFKMIFDKKEDPSVIGLPKLRTSSKGAAVVDASDDTDDGGNGFIPIIPIGCDEKIVKLTQFCGSNDDPGGWEEHIFQINGHELNKDPVLVELNKCRYDINLPGVSIDPLSILKVGTDEQDTWPNAPDHYSMQVPGWHDSTCESYQIQVAIGYDKDSGPDSYCWEGGNISNGPGVPCGEWKKPKLSYLFVLSVEPAGLDFRRPIDTGRYVQFHSPRNPAFWLGVNQNDYVKMSRKAVAYKFEHGHKDVSLRSGHAYNLVHSLGDKYVYCTSPGNVGLQTAYDSSDTFKWKVHKVGDEVHFGELIREGDTIYFESAYYPDSCLVDYRYNYDTACGVYDYNYYYRTFEVTSW